MISQTQKESMELVVYPDLSYKTVGCLFDVWSGMGFGHKEKFYQKAVALSLEERKIGFEREKIVKVQYKGNDVGIYYIDFIIDNKIDLEIKVRNYFTKQDINQLYGYLKATGLKLGIIAHFTKTGVKFKRILNIR